MANHNWEGTPQAADVKREQDGERKAAEAVDALRRILGEKPEGPITAEHMRIRYLSAWGGWRREGDVNEETGERPTHGNDGGFIVGWQYPGMGFGELTICRKEGALKIDDEGMGPEFCTAVMERLIADSFAATSACGRYGDDEPEPKVEPAP